MSYAVVLPIPGKVQVIFESIGTANILNHVTKN